MLKANLVDSVASPGVAAVLHNPETHKLVLAKNDQSVEVFSREGNTLRLIQTYPHILRNPRANDTTVKELYSCRSLSTIFARCDKSLLLFDSINFHKYDQIVDGRGIEECWVIESHRCHLEETFTTLLYATRNRYKLRMLLWEGRTYKKVVEATLPSSKEHVLSAFASEDGVVLATNHAIYHWPYGESVLVKIDRLIKRKYPSDLIGCLAELAAKAHDATNGKGSLISDTTSFMSSSRLTRKSSIASFWIRKSRSSEHSLDSTRLIFKPTNEDQICIFDGYTKNLFHLGLTNAHNPYMLASDLSQFMEWNRGFDTVQYLTSDTLILNNAQNIRIVDYNYGFTFLEQSIPEGIRWVEQMGKSHFIVLTANSRLQLYHYQVEDGTDELLADDESLCGISFDTDFNKLWRKVLFYNHVLNSPYSEKLCESKNPEHSLDLCVLKLRDLTVLWCLETFDRFQNCMSKLEANDSVNEREMVLQDIVIKKIFEKFVEFWAPPQLVVLRTFPPNICRLVPEITGQDHTCLFDDLKTRKTYVIPPLLIQRWVLPYLTDTRRHLKNLAERSTILWKHSGREIDADVNFFLIDKHQSVGVTAMLTLIDTVLFVLYLNYYPSMVGPLMRIDNLCETDLVVEELHGRCMFQELVDFYFQRGMHNNALEFLTNMIINMDQNDNSIKLQDGVKVLIIDYLKRLPVENENLLLQYTKWLLQRFGVDTAILESIFMNNLPACATRDHYQIYKFIEDYNKQVSVRYLEFVISTFDSRDVNLHTTLIELYFKDLSNANTRMKLKSVLESTSVYEPRTILRLLNELLKDKESSFSQSEKEFILFSKTYPLKKLGAHTEVINILYDDLSDYSAASNYCSDIYHDDHELGERSLNYFYKKLITHSQQTKKHSELVYFLQEHSTKLDIINIYELLPKSMPLKDFKETILQTIKSGSISKDENRINKSLLQVELINEGNALNKALSEYAVLDQNYRCVVCNKTFSTLTTDTILLFTFNKGVVIVHHNCGKALQAKIQSKKVKAREKSPKRVADLGPEEKMGE
ncbi:related to Vacuolar morphogenesis protein 6 [Zygosaccharomyces bailii ISA1307]|nr:related to Vacuolar morphogenesis protein 6 [Zygosaccharomyces bailii ISA1307]